MYCTTIDKIEIEPNILSLYVDDSLGICTQGEIKYKLFLESLNGVWPTVEFESTRENDKREIVFLDLKIKILEDYSITYEFYQKPTHCGRYLNYLLHTPEQTKINIVISEARRIIRNCALKEDAFKHLENFRVQLLNSEYPINFINKYITHAIENPIPLQKTNDEFKNCYFLSIPFINEPFTRLIKKHVKASKLNIKVIVKPGISIKNIVKPSKPKCQCEPCNNNFPCNSRDMVYQATCKFCKEKYQGATGRPGSHRFKEHEASVRRENTATTLGKHILEEHAEVDSYDDRKIENYYEFKILRHCKDTLEAFLAEDLYIKRDRPKVNNNQGNGFTF